MCRRAWTGQSARRCPDRRGCSWLDERLNWPDCFVSPVPADFHLHPTCVHSGRCLSLTLSYNLNSTPCCLEQYINLTRTSLQSPQQKPGLRRLLLIQIQVVGAVFVIIARARSIEASCLFGAGLTKPLPTAHAAASRLPCHHLEAVALSMLPPPHGSSLV